MCSNVSSTKDFLYEGASVMGVMTVIAAIVAGCALIALTYGEPTALADDIFTYSSITACASAGVSIIALIAYQILKSCY
jgi:hypothetical protein